MISFMERCPQHHFNANCNVKRLGKEFTMVRNRKEGKNNAVKIALMGTVSRWQ